MTALRVKLYEPDPPKPKLYRIGDMVKATFEGRDPYPEGVKQGDRGAMIGNLYFDGLTRDLTTGGNAGHLVGDKQPVKALEYLGAILACSRAGAQVESVDNLSPIPRVVNPGTGYWVAEGIAPTEGSMTFGLLSPAMKMAAANIDYTRNLNIVSGGLAGQVVNRELFALIARTLDAAALHGSGADSEPLGVATFPGVTSIDGSTFTATKAADMIGSCETANTDTSALRAILDPATAELLRVRAINGTGSGFILSGGKLLDIPAIVTNSAESGTIFIGDFSKMIFLQRSLELQTNPYTQGKSGVVEVMIYWHGDIVLTHPGCFAVATGVS